jgi:hypothetical protein
MQGSPAAFFHGARHSGAEAVGKLEMPMAMEMRMERIFPCDVGS